MIDEAESAPPVVGESFNARRARIGAFKIDVSLQYLGGTAASRVSENMKKWKANNKSEFTSLGVDSMKGQVDEPVLLACLEECNKEVPFSFLPCLPV